MIQVNVKNYFKMLLSHRRGLEGKTLTEDTLIRLEFSKLPYKAIPWQY